MLSVPSESTLFSARCQAKLQLRNFSLKMCSVEQGNLIKIGVYSLRRQKATVNIQMILQLTFV